MLAWYRQYRRQSLLRLPYPDGWETLLTRNVAHYRLLSAGEQARLRNDLRILVAEKNWEGCGGLLVTEEMKVTIAGQACLMLLGMEHDYFSRVLSILVYPAAFRVYREGPQGDQVGKDAAAGEAVYRGPVIMAWDAALTEGQNPSVGRNVVIHEFAHQLDFLDGYINGTPRLGDGAQDERWYEVMTAEIGRAHV